MRVVITAWRVVVRRVLGFRETDINWGLVHRRKVDSTSLNLEKLGPLMGVVAKALTGSHSGRAF